MSERLEEIGREKATTVEKAQKCLDAAAALAADDLGEMRLLAAAQVYATLAVVEELAGLRHVAW